MGRSGLAIFILLSGVVHVAAALLFVDRPPEILEERGAGATALEIGNLFDSVGQNAVEATWVESIETPEKTAAPVKVAKAARIEPARTVEPKAPALAAVAPVQAFTPNEALAKADIYTAEALEPVKPEDSLTPEMAKLTPAEPVVEKPVDSAEKPEPIKPEETQARIVERLPATKPPAPKAAAVRQVQPAKTAAKAQEARQASIASRKGGSVANSKGKAGATGGNGGKSASNGTALTSNYMGKVRSRVARKKRYPNAARRRGETGTAVIRFVVAQNGSMSGLGLVRSSGSKALDEAALSMAQRAAPFPKIPQETGKARITFTLPISFTKP
nr:energy transducer TonB [uncultured Cohaesibacter sp.]